jgi:hypothetical protein
MSLQKMQVITILYLMMFFSATTISAATYSIDITISGLESMDLGAYDFYINWDASSSDFHYNSHILSDHLGRLDLHEADDLSTPYIAGSNSLNLSVLSYLQNLDTQPYAFTLATVIFSSNQDSLPDLSLSNIILSDHYGDSIPYTVSGMHLTAVPIPGTTWLMGLSLASLIGFRKRFCR